MKLNRLSLIAAALVGAACSASSSGTATDTEVSRQTSEALHRGRAAERLVQTNLVSDQPGVARALDPNLVNAWGLAFNPAGPPWISANGTGLLQVYNRSEILVLSVSVPLPAGGEPPASPTGQVFNGGAAFEGDRFIAATEDGTIAAWQPSDRTTAMIRVNQAATGALYKGITIANDAHGNPRLFATDFRNNKVDVFDSSYAPIRTVGEFRDCDMPDGFAPFNIQQLGGLLYVTYAKQGPTKEDDEAGPGNGFVDLFDADGVLLQRLVSGGPLNSPWGLTIAPAGFGKISNRLLIGNFGNGQINAFEIERRSCGALQTKHEGVIGDASGAPLVIAGLWALSFGPGAGGFDADQLYFTAGPGNEEHGLFGRLELR